MSKPSTLTQIVWQILEAVLRLELNWRALVNAWHGQHAEGWAHWFRSKFPYPNCSFSENKKTNLKRQIYLMHLPLYRFIALSIINDGWTAGASLSWCNNTEIFFCSTERLKSSQLQNVMQNAGFMATQLFDWFSVRYNRRTEHHPRRPS